VDFAVQAIQHCRIAWTWKFASMKSIVANRDFTFQSLMEMGMETVVCGDGCCRAIAGIGVGMG